MSKTNKDVERLIKTTLEYNPGSDTDLIRLAYDFAEKAHSGQRRMSGEFYIVHPLATAQFLAEMGVHPNIVAAGLLHDVPEDTSVNLKEIEKNFGKDIASMVRGITKLGTLKYRGVERYIENLRKMFVAMAQDVRVILIKFADRIHNLQTLEALPPKKRYRIALESLEIFAPIANRLGMGEIKGLLEDFSFKYVFPKEYEWVRKVRDQKTQVREEYFERVIKKVSTELKKANIEVSSIHWRKKNLYSMYEKIQKQDNDVNRVYDLIALRVIVHHIADCYAVLGVLHKLWKPLKGRIKDYIAQPKPNGYQSLHTTVFSIDGEIIEFQIRTIEMHETAEYGIAAHWNYDEKSGSVIPSKELAWVKQLAKLQKDIMKRMQDLELLKVDFFKNRIFVFTPKGDVIDLPEDATPIDFAYSIHSDIGDTCSGARINENIVSLDTPLKNGDVVDILVDKNRKGPSPDWINFVKTTQARSRIKQSTKQRLLSINKFFSGFK